MDKTKGNNINVGTNFRRWVNICSVGNAPAGTYLIEVQTNGVGADDGNGQNAYSLRAFSSTDSTAKDAISIGAYNSMTIAANVPAANTKFNLARVPGGTSGQILNIRLFDVGDAADNGTITIQAPTGSGVTFSNCKASGPVSGNLPTCSLNTTPSLFQGKWENVAVTIPPGYQCTDSDPTLCWVILNFSYPAGVEVWDTTSWTASIEGDPVRLVY